MHIPKAQKNNSLYQIQMPVLLSTDIDTHHLFVVHLVCIGCILDTKLCRTFLIFRSDLSCELYATDIMQQLLLMISPPFWIWGKTQTFFLCVSKTPF